MIKANQVKAHLKSLLFTTTIYSMKKKSLGPLERKVMEIIWQQKQATVYSVVSQLSKEKELAYTTVMTVMARLAKKKILQRKKDGKTYVYTATQTKEKFIHQLVKNTIARMVDSFGETAAVAFLDETKNLSAENTDRLLKKISES